MVALNGIRGERGEKGEPGPKATWLRLTLIVWMVVFSVLVSYSLKIQQDEVHRSSRQATQTKAALCAFRADLGARIKSGRVVLAHPAAYGITPATILILRSSLANEQATVDSLSGLGC